MKLHSMGDSHSDFSFRELPVERHPIGAVTMDTVGKQRTGTSSSEILDQWIARQGVPSDDTLILAFGEIDMRCQVQRQIDAGGNADQVIQELAEGYVTTIKGSKFKNLCVMSVPPPCTAASCQDRPMWEYPVIGTDQDRSEWTIQLNTLLKQKCDKEGIPFLNVYPGYADEHGMLIEALADTLHIGDTTYVGSALHDLFGD